MAKIKSQKQRQPRKDFAEKFAEKLQAMQLGQVDAGALADGSGRWVNIRIKHKELCFSFDMKGERIDRIGLYKDEIEVVDHILIFGN